MCIGRFFFNVFMCPPHDGLPSESSEFQIVKIFVIPVSTSLTHPNQMHRLNRIPQKQHTETPDITGGETAPQIETGQTRKDPRSPQSHQHPETCVVQRKHRGTQTKIHNGTLLSRSVSQPPPLATCPHDTPREIRDSHQPQTLRARTIKQCHQ